VLLQFTLKALLRRRFLPKLHRLFAEQGIVPELYATQWYDTVFKSLLIAGLSTQCFLQTGLSLSSATTCLSM
jgi:hypothetical protein